MADQLRRDCLGCFGNRVVQTPHIDALAEQGTVLTNMYAAYPVCAPNRASIFTGRYPSCHKVVENGRHLPKTEITLMHVLRENGYSTYGAGKMHFGPQWRFPPDGSVLVDPDRSLAFDPQPDETEYPWYGFDRVAITEDHRVGPYEDYLQSHGLSLDGELDSASYPQSSTEPSPIPAEHHQTSWITKSALSFLAQHRKSKHNDKPYFLKVSYVHPHHPFNPPQPYDKKYDPADIPLPVWSEDEVPLWPEAYQQKFHRNDGSHEGVGLSSYKDADWQRIRASYYGMIEMIDTSIGRIIDDLSAHDEYENTIFVFTTDHGEMLGDHRLLFKGTTYDCVTGVPFIASGPGISAGRFDDLCSSVDIMPTVLSVVGLQSPDAVQGDSLVSLFTAGGVTTGKEAVLIENAGDRRTVRTKSLLYTFHGSGKRGELYNLQDDPHCLSNLWDKDDQLRMRASEQLVQLLTSASADPVPKRVGVW